jgi:putative endonuclease
MAEHLNTGKKGEDLAAKYLADKGFEILEKNWRYKHLEADIIALQKKTLVIVEVKTRSSNFFGEPESFVNKQKQRNLKEAANQYIEQNNMDVECRFDIVSVVLATNQSSKIHHIEDAFLF